eukprot:4118179-Amphidinium_carterae.1
MPTKRSFAALSTNLKLRGQVFKPCWHCAVGMQQGFAGRGGVLGCPRNLWPGPRCFLCKHCQLYSRRTVLAHPFRQAKLSVWAFWDYSATTRLGKVRTAASFAKYKWNAGQREQAVLKCYLVTDARLAKPDTQSLTENQHTIGTIGTQLVSGQSVDDSSKAIHYRHIGHDSVSESSLPI